MIHISPFKTEKKNSKDKSCYNILDFKNNLKEIHNSHLRKTILELCFYA